MTTVSISKIQLRRGLSTDLPGIPTSITPLIYSPGLDEGELGYTTNTGRLFVGVGDTTPVSGSANYNRQIFPYQNIEVLTENSPASVFNAAIRDNQTGFFTSLPLLSTTGFHNLQIITDQIVEDLQLDLLTLGAGASIDYFLFDSGNNPIRQGRLTVLWNTNYVTPPLCSEEAQCMVSAYTTIQWQAAINNSHVVLQYNNTSGDTPTAYFRIDRLHP